MNEIREIKFAGFAATLNKKLNNFAFSFGDTYPGSKTLQQGIEKIIAQHSYDLVMHAVKHTHVKNKDEQAAYYRKALEPSFAAEIESDIPDLTEF